MQSRNFTKGGSGYKASFSKRSVTSLYEDDVNEAEFGEETEAEKHLKVLLQKQLNTKVSFKEQFAQHRTFSSSSTYNSLTEFIHGPCTLSKFKEIEKNEELHQELQRCGLSEEEIIDYLLFKSGKKKRNCIANPEVWNDYLKSIEKKIMTHNEDLMKPQAFKNVKKLTRHEMEIEQSLYAGCPDKSKLSTLVSVVEDNATAGLDSAFQHIKDLSQKLLNSRRKKQKKSKKKESLSSSNIRCSDDEASNFEFDSNIHHVIVPLEEDDVKEKRLSLDEIRMLPRFENYEMGIPSKTLYLKNLHPKVTIHELRSLFSSFEDENKSTIDYKLCSGRMKGQAFVKFSDAEIAAKALQHANGYLLRGKPIIIVFGRQS